MKLYNDPVSITTKMFSATLIRHGNAQSVTIKHNEESFSAYDNGYEFAVIENKEIKFSDKNYNVDYEINNYFSFMLPENGQREVVLAS